MAKIRIQHALDEVWSVFTEPSTWKKWWGGDLKAVTPAWGPDATLEWEMGSQSRVCDYVEKDRFAVEGSYGERVIWTFRAEGLDATSVLMVANLGSSALSASNDSSLEAEYRGVLDKLRACVEGYDGVVTATAESAEQAFAAAEKKLPPTALIVGRSELPRKRRTERELFWERAPWWTDDLTERCVIDAQWPNWLIKKVEVITEPRKGFLGFGRTLGECEYHLEEREVTVEVKYSKARSEDTGDRPG